MLDEIAIVGRLVRFMRALAREAESAAAAAGSEHVTATRRIERTAWAVTAVGCLAVPCAAPLAAVLVLGITAGDALFRSLLGLVISTGVGFLYFPGGAALGCVLAPDWFIRGPAGRVWWRVFGGRASSAVIALLAFGLMAGMGLLLYGMAPTRVW